MLCLLSSCDSLAFSKSPGARAALKFHVCEFSFLKASIALWPFKFTSTREVLKLQACRSPLFDDSLAFCPSKSHSVRQVLKFRACRLQFVTTVSHQRTRGSQISKPAAIAADPFGVAFVRGVVINRQVRVRSAARVTTVGPGNLLDT